MKIDLEKIYKEIEDEYKLFHSLFDMDNVDTSDEYKKINYAYFRVFATHYESIPQLIRTGYISSGIVLVRTMLETFVKSYYLEFIAKNNGDIALDYIKDVKQFPNFFEMTQQLENVKNENEIGFDGVFSQFTKSFLASYEKYTLFSHGKGEFLKAYYEHEKISYTSEQISEVLLTVKGMFAGLAMLLFHIQGSEKELKHFINKVNV